MYAPASRLTSPVELCSCGEQHHPGSQRPHRPHPRSLPRVRPTGGTEVITLTIDRFRWYTIGVASAGVTMGLSLAMLFRGIWGCQ